jgi:RNA polymerase sigma factor (sigma-70 family)
VTPRRLIEPARLAGSTLLRTQSDARLVDLARAGHDAAFEAIVQRYRRPLLAYCGRVLPDARAEDAVQQTFLSAYQAMTRDEAELTLRPWLYRIARNTSLNLLRQNGWSHDQLSENLDGVERPDQALERSEQLRSTVDAVKALPDRQRDALILRELEGKRYDEIAADLGVGDGAVRQLLHRARATLRAGASALTPVGLLERIAELAGGAGGVGAVKMGAALLATGAIAGGTLATPITRHHGQKPAPVHAAAAEKPKRVAERTVAEHVTPGPVVVRHHAPSPRQRQALPYRHRRSDHSGPGSDDHQVTRERDDGDDRPGSSGGHDNSGPGSGSELREPTPTTTAPLPEDHSGSGSSGSGDSSGPGGGGDDGASSSGSSGSDDRSSGSGSSGSGSSGSGSGSTGSGSDDGH